MVDEWRAFVALAGNESFTTKEGCNVNNRMSRRTVGFHFGRAVPDHDRTFDDRAEADMAAIIWVCTWALKV